MKEISFVSELYEALSKNDLFMYIKKNQEYLY